MHITLGHNFIQWSWVQAWHYYNINSVVKVNSSDENSSRWLEKDSNVKVKSLDTSSLGPLPLFLFLFLFLPLSLFLAPQIFASHQMVLIDFTFGCPARFSFFTSSLFLYPLASHTPLDIVATSDDSSVKLNSWETWTMDHQTSCLLSLLPAPKTCSRPEKCLTPHLDTHTHTHPN